MSDNPKIDDREEAEDIAKMRLMEQITGMDYTELLRMWRFSPTGNPLLSGEVGNFFEARMKHLRSLPGGDEMHTRASKSIGW